jgi:hypothetical protein
VANSDVTVTLELDSCVMEDCDQAAIYCQGHFDQERHHADKLNTKVQDASLIIRALLTRLEREGIHNADMLAAQEWLK